MTKDASIIAELRLPLLKMKVSFLHCEQSLYILFQPTEVLNELLAVDPLESQKASECMLHHLHIHERALLKR
jgi:hypothetical protein